jgi:hypothetical protein
MVFEFEGIEPVVLTDVVRVDDKIVVVIELLAPVHDAQANATDINIASVIMKIFLPLIRTFILNTSCEYL